MHLAPLIRDLAVITVVAGLVTLIFRKIRQPVVLPDRRNVSVGASTGVAVFPSGDEPERASDVFDRADRALYRCKAEGRSAAAKTSGSVA